MWFNKSWKNMLTFFLTNHKNVDFFSKMILKIFLRLRREKRNSCFSKNVNFFLENVPKKKIAPSARIHFKLPPKMLTFCIKTMFFGPAAGLWPGILHDIDVTLHDITQNNVSWNCWFSFLCWEYDWEHHANNPTVVCWSRRSRIVCWRSWRVLWKRCSQMFHISSLQKKVFETGELFPLITVW